MKTIAILQPGYLPWLGFFDQMVQSQAFVIYDDVQYDKHGWRNRNRIRTAEGWQWLTVPVLTKGKATQTIREVKINPQETWQDKHLKALRQHYGKTPFAKEYLPVFQATYAEPWESLFELNMALIDKIVGLLQIKTPIFFSSQMNVHGERTERLIEICKSLDGTEYLTGDKAEEYLDEPLFEKAGIKVRWHHYKHPVYPQSHSPFVPYLSAIDLLLNCGAESLDILTGKKEDLICLPSL